MADVFSLRLPPSAVKALRRLARRSGNKPTQLAREWIIERIEQEERALPSSSARESAAPYRARGRRRPLDLRDEIATICARRGVRTLALFGSAARSDFDPKRSDADFLVDFLQMPIGLRPDSHFGLVDDLEKLLGRHVDLVDTNALTNPYLRAAIERDLVMLYEAA